MNAAGEPYYRADLSVVHDRGFGTHGDLCAPGMLSLLEPGLRTIVGHRLPGA